MGDQNSLIDAGWGHVCLYIKNNDSHNDDLTCWGFNRYYQLETANLRDIRSYKDVESFAIYGDTN